MKRYFYHGIENYPLCYGSILKKVVSILEKGLIVRNKVNNYNKDELNHVCLYRKNEEYDYEKDEYLINSARGNWIDGGFVFILNPNLNAIKTEIGEKTNLVDEWRYFDNIPISEFRGIALPFSSIREYLNTQHKKENEEDYKEWKLFLEYYPKMLELISKLNLKKYDSEKPDFTNEIDNELDKSHHKGK